MTSFREAAMRILERLESAGFQAFLVGGCVRDRLRGVEPSDYDVATDARPEKVMQLFPGSAPTGLSHGTVTVTATGAPVEVTTFRREGGYSDLRRPDHVQFVFDLREDLARRDFTINAMAEDRHGHIVDPFGGQKDLELGLIRAVGQPTARFAEDALRMIRALRFVAQMGFRLDEETEAAITICRDGLKSLAVERITSELDRMWHAHQPAMGAILLWKHDLFPFLPPFFMWESSPVPKKPLYPAGHLDRLDGADVRWAFFLFSCGVKAEEMGCRLRSLRLAGKRVKRITTLATIATTSPLPVKEEDAKRRMLETGGEWYRQAIPLFAALGRLEPWQASELKRQVAAWHREMPVQRREDLAVDGRELAEALELLPGPWLKPLLVQLLEQVALGKIPNRKTDLIQAGREWVKKEAWRIVKPDT